MHMTSQLVIMTSLFTMFSIVSIVTIMSIKLVTMTGGLPMVAASFLL